MRAFIHHRFLVTLTVLSAINGGGWLWLKNALLESGPGGAPQVRVQTILPRTDLDAASRLAIIFDRPLGRVDQIGEIEIDPLYTIEPRPPGRWHWAARNRLEFLLDEALRPGRRYLLRPVADFEARTGRVLAGQRAYRLSTRRLALEKCELQSVDPSNVTFALSFNQAVHPRDVLRHLSVAPGQGAFPAGHRNATRATRTARARPTASTVRALGTDPATTLILQTARPVKDSLVVALRKGLTGHDAELGLQTVERRVLALPRRFVLVSTHVYEPGLERDIDVRLNFSHQLNSKAALPRITIEPPVGGVRSRIEYGDLVLRGPFTCGRRYQATIGPNLLDRAGKPLGVAQRVSISIPDRGRRLRFKMDDGILTPHGNLQLDVSAVNVHGIHIEAHRIYANNLVPHLRGDSVVSTARGISDLAMTLDLPHNTPGTAVLDVRDVVEEPLGVYVLKARDPQGHWRARDEAVIAVTDLAITAKRTRTGYTAWITSLRSGEPVPGARVTALSYTNQTLESAHTDDRGLARLALSEDDPNGSAWVLTAQRGEDLAYLRPDERPWVLDDIDASGRPWSRHYDVLVYADRGAYRPGDDIHITGIVRGVDGAIPEPFPLSINVLRPDGRSIAEPTVTPGTQGEFSTTVSTPAEAQTGHYTIRCRIPGDEHTLGGTGVLVEAFAPVRLEVEAAARVSAVAFDDTPQIDVSARYLFGRAADGLPVRVSGTYRRIVPHGLPDSTGFSFEPPATPHDTTVDIDVIDSLLDEDGRATIVIPDPPADPSGLWRAELTVTVSEPGGRSVSTAAQLQVDRVGRHLGLGIVGGRVVDAKQPLSIRWLRHDTHPDAIAPEMELHLERLEHDITLQEVSGRSVWRSTERSVRVSQCVLEKDAAEFSRTIELDPPGAGRFRLTITDPASGAGSTLIFHASDDAAQPGAGDIRDPGRLELVLDRPQYRPGEQAELLVRSPFAGLLLLTLETNEVIEERLVHLDGRSAQITLPVPESLRGGAFISGTVVRAVDPHEHTWLPHRAIGLTPLRTSHADHALALHIDAPDEARPGDALDVIVSTESPLDFARPPAVQLWAVDEGLLMATGHVTVDPLEHYFGHRAAAVDSADVFADLLPDHRRPAGMTRIGADAAVRGLRSPVDAPPAEAVVLWHGFKAVDDMGRAVFAIDLPEYTGRLRLMAVAVDGDRYAASDHDLTVSAPLVIHAGWPRCAAPGDRFEVPLRVFNSTAFAQAAEIELDIEGPLIIDLSGSSFESSVVLPPQGDTTLWVSCRARSSGSVRARTTVRADPAGGLRGFENHARATLAIRPPSTPTRESGFTRFAAGERFAVPDDGCFMQGTERLTVTLGPRPTVHLQPAIDALIDYPYGCVEQTSSTLLALLHAVDVLESDQAQTERVTFLRSMIQAGIDRLWSMQTLSGGLAYWPGSTESNTWGSAYAGYVLAEAHRLHWKVGGPRLDELLAFLDAELQRPQNGRNTAALASRVLAAFERGSDSWLSTLHEQRAQLDMAGLAHVASAWQLAGRRDRAREVLQGNILEPLASATHSGRITSAVTQDALLLATVLDIDSEHAWAALLATRLNAARRGSVWGSTLENATAIAALSRYRRAVAGSAVPAFYGTIRYGGLEQGFDHRSPTTVTFIRPAGAALTVDTTGTGDIYVATTREGVPRDAAAQTMAHSHGLEVQRRWLTPGGTPLRDDATVRVGDLIEVEITLRGIGADAIDNVAIVDPLPGGFEVENPRLATSTRTRRSHLPDRVEFLDDRVVLFATADEHKRVFRYPLRAVAPGTFQVAGAHAACMYDSALSALSGPPCSVEVRR